ncbi:MAG: hypothetical protein KFH98_12520 [Gemmatimonadetes bacterium]|nr:hypothetical protein [Gemmatimonadota bacterium]
MTRSSLRVLLASSLILPLFTACSRGGERVLELGSPTTWHTCPPPAEWPEPVSREVGNQGDTLRSGNNVLVIPPGALPGNSHRTFTLAPYRSDSVGVEVTMSAQGKLKELMTLEVDMRCDGGSTQWSIWRIRPGMQNPSQSQKLDTQPGQLRLTVQVDTTSGFMIAN